MGNRIDDLTDLLKENISKVNSMINVQQREEEKAKSKIVWIFTIIGVVVALAAICYAVYKFFSPDYLEDFEDDLDDDFDDDFFDDEDDEDEAFDEPATEATEKEADDKFEEE